MSPTDQKTLNKIASLIKKHIGKDNPIQVDELIKQVHLPDREIRRSVQTLINEFGHAIGSTTRNPYGFFMIANNDDFSEAIGNLSGRDEEIVRRIKKLFDNCKANGVKIKNYKKNVVSKNTTINIKNIYFIISPQ